MVRVAIVRSTGYRGVSPAAAQRHYDVSDDFFRIWLGPSLAYSSALWADPENLGEDTLESAQLRKMDYLFGQAGIRPGHRVLDIGCGYGSEVRRLVDEYGIDQAVGLTLSQAQVSWLRAHPVPRFEVRLENWVDHRPARPYDAILSLEAFEHFARPGMSGARKVRAYRRFFEHCRAMLHPDGMMVVQTISWGRRFPLEPQFLRDLQLATTVFPECNPSFLVEIVRACDGIFDIVALRNDNHHYSRTARAWVTNLEADWDRAVGLIGPTRANNFKRCLNTAVRAFAEGWFFLHRITFRPVPRPSRPARRFLVNNVLGRGPSRGSE